MRRKDKSPRGAVNLDELSPEVRDKIMAKIEPSNEAPMLEMPDVAGNFPATPEGNEALAALVIDVVMKLRAFLEKYGPEIEDLKARFMALPRDKYNRGKTTIAGCRTWEEFCELKLGRTPSALRKALAAPKVKVEEKPKVFLAVLKRLLPMADPVVPLGVFSRAENGNVLITVAREDYGTASDTLPVAAPDMEKVILCDGVHPNHPAPPFRWTANIQQLMDFLKRCDGDPRIFYFGQGRPLEFQEWDGQLSFKYDPRYDLGYDLNAEERDKSHYRYVLAVDFSEPSGNFLDEVRCARAEQHQPYTGDFLPDLKVGDKVTVYGGYRVEVQEVTKVTGASIATLRHVGDREDFDREGISRMGWRILRITTEQDLVDIAEAEIKEEEARAEERRAEEAIEAEREAFIQATAAQWLRIPAEIRVGQPNRAAVNHIHVGISLSVTVAQLEKIADALTGDVAGNFPATSGPEE